MIKGIYAPSGRPGNLEDTLCRMCGAGGDRLSVAVDGPLAVVTSESAGRFRAEGVSCTFSGSLYDPAGPAAGDAERVARAYMQTGVEGPAGLRGRFAFALWDENRGRGLLASDTLCTQPLFFWQGGGLLVFAGELADLLALLPTRPEPDPVAFPAWLAGCSASGERSLYRDVRRLSPGQLLELDDAPGLRTYWQPRYAGTASGSRRELAEGLAERVEAAVGRRLSPRSSGVVLSGGLDSSIVAAAAARVRASDSQLITYSASFPGAEYDETWKVRELAAATGVEPRFFELAPKGGLWLGLRHLEHCGLPLMGNAALIDIAMVAAASGDGAEVVLEGQTGDELFGLSPWLLADRIAQGRLLSALALAGEFPGWPKDLRTRIRILKRWGLKGVAPRWLREARVTGFGAPPWLRPSLQSSLAQALGEWAWKESLRGPRWWRYQADLLVHAPHREFRLDYLRHRASQAGVRAETPLYDFDLIEYCLRLPPQLAFDPTLNRPLARESVRGTVPDAVRLHGEKANFSAFCFEMLIGDDAAGIDKLLMAPDAELGAYVDMDRVRRLWREERPGRHAGPASAAWGTEIWKLAVAESWLRSHADPSFAAEMLSWPEVSPPEVRAAGGGTGTFFVPTFSGLVSP